MAHKIINELVDDLDGSVAAETVRFGLDGVQYEIDLSADNASQMRDWLASYTSHGRRVSARAKRVAKRNGPAVRVWAQDQGIAISSQGRVPTTIQGAYDRAHSPT